MPYFRTLLLVFLLFSLIGLGEVWGQCGTCTIIYTNATGNPTPNRNIQNNDVVCITANRTTQINLRNANNLSVCISSGITYSNTFSNLGGNNVEINNFGEFGTSGTPRNLTLGNNGTFNNLGNYFGNLISNNGSSINNSGGITGNVSLNSTGAVYNNSGTQLGELQLNNNTLINSGNLNLTLLTIGNGSPGITNTISGNIVLSQNANFNITAPFNNAGFFSFTANNRNLSISNGNSVVNTGTFLVGGDFSNNGTFDSRSGALTIGGNLANNNSATIYPGIATIAGNFTNNNVAILNGGLIVGGNLIINNSGVIQPLNLNQCNSVDVSGNITNNNSNGINDSNLPGLGGISPLLINKVPSNNGVVGGVIIDPSLDCSCGARFTSDGTFFVPQGVTTITIESIGGGGRGGTRTNSGNATGGGGGGAYSSSTIDVIPGEPLKIVVGQGATSVQAGGDSWVSRTELLSDAFILAVGGQSVNNNQTTGAIGGQASEGIGQIKFSGGTGSQGSTTPQNGRGGGGGGAGSATGVGGSATGRNGGSSSGIGGAGGTAVDGPTENGFQGANYGGGGSGSSKNTGNSTPSNGGNGANGYVKISFICPPLELTPCSQVISLGEIGGYYIIEYNCDDIWEAPEGLLEFEVLAIGGGAGGGGRNDGGGGGSGGVVYARANIEPQFVNGLPAGTSYSIVIGNGGAGGTSSNNSTSIGSDGGDSFFDLGGNYEIIAAGGGGGGSTNNGAGRNGRNSSIATTTDFSTSQPEGILRGGAGGGQRRTEGSGVGSGANGSGNGSAGSGSGNGAGGAGGGVNGNAGISGGNNFGRPGGPGIQFSFGLFNTNDFFSAGGGGGGNIGGNGGSSGAGGSGGSNNGLDATTPGSGGGGAEGDSNTGGRGSDGRIYIRYPIFRILPVEYLYFNAKYNSFMRSGDLSWATAKEWENSHFEIERSVNDIKSWTVIDQIEGAGYSDGPVEYSYTDKNLPAAGGNIFYRLRQVDFSGNSSYSVTRAIQVDKVDGKDSWAAYPNPTSGDVFKLDLIDNQAYNDEHIKVRLISPHAGSISFQGRDLREISDGIQQSLQKSSNGVYILEISWGQKIEFLKILKRN